MRRNFFKSRRKPRLFIAGLILLLAVGFAGCVQAAPAPTVKFCWTVEGREITIRLFEKSRDDVYLFLPAALKGQDPVVRIDQGAEFIFEDQHYPDGSVFPAEQYVGQSGMAFYSTGKRIGNVAVMRGSEIPALFFTMPDDQIRRIEMNTKLDIQQDAAVVILDGDGSLTTAQAVPHMKTRGNSTFFSKKKAYQFKLDKKASLGGMEKNKTWILLANYFDVSLIRNQITFDLLREMGMAGTPDCRQADLYINGEYRGTYLLTEKIQIKSGRLEIRDLEDELEKLNGQDAYDAAVYKRGRGEAVYTTRWFDVEEPEDVTGGYLLEIEKELHFNQNKTDAGFATDKTMCVIVKEPSHVGYRGMTYISNLVNDFHHAVLASDGRSKNTGRYYASFIDMRSFALKIIVEEFTANFDVRAGSQFMYKDSDSVDPLLHAGPGWDYDLTYGDRDDGLRNPTKEDYVFRRSSSEVYLYHWLLTHDDFRGITRQLLEDVFMPAAEVLAGRRDPAPGSGLRSLKAYEEELRASAGMNFKRWSAYGQSHSWNGAGRTFEDACAFVQDWIDQRMDMMNEKWLIDAK